MARVSASLLAAGLAAAVVVTAAPAYAATTATPVTGLVATPADRQVTLRWTNPTDADFAGVTIREAHDGTTPASITDGAPVYEGTAQSKVVTGLANGTAYTFAVFARTTANDVSDPVTKTTTPVPAVLTKLTLSVSPRYVTYGGNPRVTAVLRRSDNGAVAPGETVFLWRKPYGAGGYTKVYRLTTNSSGAVSHLTSPTNNTLWYASHSATPYLAASTSAAHMSYVRAKVAVTRTPATVQQNQASTVRVTVTPDHSGREVLLQRLVGRAWKGVASKRLSSGSTASFAVKTDVIGTRTYRVVKPHDADHANGYFHAFGIVTVRRTLRAGMTGADVAKAQRRLAYLHYDVRETGTFDYDTVHATMAFQKVNRLTVNGEISHTAFDRLWHQATPRLRYPQSGSWVEIDLTRQTLYLTGGGAVTRILDVSSGSERYFTVDGETQRAVTPTGSFRVFHKIDGQRVSRLGTLWRPAYFASGGYAIHGSSNVPAYPDSHGCVRVTNNAMNRLFPLLPLGIRVYVYRS
jgi:peptidoglycan hydrolase-like protein with peptidoglycan-binding domain